VILEIEKWRERTMASHILGLNVDDRLKNPMRR